ncbi:MAG TPA: GNAT family N-acetyltransferase [Kofleriaceae bacterium]|nr:GNAT family N-acetyltransferase [Kofleriaceae bacterium]
MDLAGLEARADELDRAALAAPEIDRFCSSSAWVLPAAVTLMDPGDPWLVFEPDGFLSMVVRRHERMRAVESLEAAWGLASPLVGPDAGRLAGLASEVLRAREGSWDVALLSGLPVGSRLLAECAARLGVRYRLGVGPVTRRHTASLAGGVDGFLGRRSRQLRKTLRQAERRAAAAGVVFEDAAAGDVDALYERVLAIEERCWKARDGIGITVPDFREFYRLMVRRLAAVGRLRALVATAGGRDVAYVLGAVFGDTYRGLQFSFDDEHRALGLGNLAQLAQVRLLAEREPAVVQYDLGTGGEYKAAWAEAVMDSVILIAAR